MCMALCHVWIVQESDYRIPPKVTDSVSGSIVHYTPFANSPALKKCWDARLAGLVHAYNDTRYRTTRFSPFYVMVGSCPKAKLPTDILIWLFGRNWWWLGIIGCRIVTKSSLDNQKADLWKWLHDALPRMCNYVLKHMFQCDHSLYRDITELWTVWIFIQTGNPNL